MGRPSPLLQGLGSFAQSLASGMVSTGERRHAEARADAKDQRNFDATQDFRKSTLLAGAQKLTAKATQHAADAKAKMLSDTIGRATTHPLTAAQWNDWTPDEPRERTNARIEASSKALLAHEQAKTDMDRGRDESLARTRGGIERGNAKALEEQRQPNRVEVAKIAASGRANPVDNRRFQLMQQQLRDANTGIQQERGKGKLYSSADREASASALKHYEDQAAAIVRQAESEFPGLSLGGGGSPAPAEQAPAPTQAAGDPLPAARAQYLSGDIGARAALIRKIADEMFGGNDEKAAAALRGK